mmetsp:Transcript_37777/g.92870  ORF Transcript_37777/g.92870 Transcript_37777/m.92870 type:complete len:344 (-) Transcript_37777:120-1151(-)
MPPKHLEARSLGRAKHPLRLLHPHLDLLVLPLHDDDALLGGDVVGLSLLPALDLDLADALGLLEHLQQAVAALHELAAQLLLVLAIDALLLVARLDLGLHLADASLARLARGLLPLVQVLELPGLLLILLKRLLGGIQVRARLLQQLGELRDLILGRAPAPALEPLLLALHLCDDVGLLLDLRRDLVDPARQPRDLLLVLNRLRLAAHKRAAERLKLDLAVLQLLAELLQHLLQASLLLERDVLGLAAHEGDLVGALRAVLEDALEAQVDVGPNLPTDDALELYHALPHHVLLLNGHDVVAHAHRAVVLRAAALHNRAHIHLVVVLLVLGEEQPDARNHLERV